jgi:hypothetical protein
MSPTATEKRVWAGELLIRMGERGIPSLRILPEMVRYILDHIDNDWKMELTLRSAAADIGKSYTAVRNCLLAMEKAGMIRWDRKSELSLIPPTEEE